MGTSGLSGQDRDPFAFIGVPELVPCESLPKLQAARNGLRSLGAEFGSLGVEFLGLIAEDVTQQPGIILLMDVFGPTDDNAREMATLLTLYCLTASGDARVQAGGVLLREIRSAVTQIANSLAVYRLYEEAREFTPIGVRLAGERAVTLMLDAEGQLEGLSDLLKSLGASER